MNDGARPPLARGLIGALAVLQLALHLGAVAITPYELHRDELLYMAMGDHLRFWRMDFPPFIAVVANVARFLFGDTLFAVRVFPAIAAAVIVWLAALIARDFGGRWRAQGLAALAVIASPLFMRVGALFQPVVFDQLWWTLALWALVRIGRGDGDRWWTVLGIAFGFGLLTKFSILFIGLATFVAIVVTPLRRTLLTSRPWLAGVIALVIGSASIVGQLRLGFPVRGQFSDLAAQQLAHVTIGGFFAEQLMMNAAASLLALAGVWALLADRRFRFARTAGIAAVGALLLLAVMHGKAYYAGPIYPLLFAAGAVWLDALPAPRALYPLQIALAALMIVTTIALLPLGLPILAPPLMERYVAATIGSTATTTNVGDVERIPQDFADMLNWRQQAEAVARAYHALPDDERRDAVLVGGNYGEAGAIDFYGKRLGLPPAVAPTGSYWFFGPGEKPGRVIVTLGIDSTDLVPLCGRVVAAGRVGHPYAVAEERDVAVHVCLDPRVTLQQFWPSRAGQ